MTFTLGIRLDSRWIPSRIFVRVICISLERGLNVISTGNGFICLSPPTKIRCAFLFYLQKDRFSQCFSVRRDLHPMADDDLCHVTKSFKCPTVLSTNNHFPW